MSEASITNPDTRTLHLRYALALAGYVDAEEKAAEYKLHHSAGAGGMSKVKLPDDLMNRLIDALNIKRDAQLAWWAHCDGILQAHEIEKAFAEAGESFVG